MVHIVLLAGICFISYIMKTPYFKLPLDRDYGGHGYVAYCWLKKKGMPYRDILETKTPGLKIIYMIIMKWLGLNRKAFRLFFALYNILTTIAIYALGTELFSPAAGLIAALLYALYSSVPSLWWHFSNTESYYVLPSVLTFYFLIMGIDNQGLLGILFLFIAGLFCGITFMFKQPALINTAGPSYIYLALFPPNNLLYDTGLFTIGFIIPMIWFIIYFVVIHKTPWTKTPFGTMILNNIRVYLSTPLFKVSRGTIESNRRRFRTILYDLSFLGITGSAGCFAIITNGNTPSSLLVLWVALSILSAIISRTYLAYHFIPVVPPLCILSGMVMQTAGYTIFTNGFSEIKATDAIALSVMTLLLFLFLFQLIKDLLLPKEIMDVFYSGEDKLYALTEEVGKYIKANTSEEDYVYSWGHEPEIYFWSERRAPSFCIFPPICNPQIFSKEHISSEFVSLIQKNPKFIVITSEFGQFKDFEKIVVHNYVLEKRYDPYLYLFKLRTL